ncbi:hypothetical protein AB870_14435 [Pandoraea faecigallinarum]|uniref:HD/PDEase domain-containing protein n=1 Tax=Pandoraea faecigallinarum TaxID=656179 RepID=A0A0H3WS81_9BURK|nr:HD domain-containing protein [Pandoraea faecigallinarum]AKM31059.1 hypothetical protein AB870_14435 [Pandoraea faecigallinarum]
MLGKAFSPYESTITAVLDMLGLAAQADSDDGSHDWSHLIRVWTLAKEIAASEAQGAHGPDTSAVDLEMLAVATLLHDCVAVEKNDPRRAQASRLSADKARQILHAMGWPAGRIDATAHVIEAHSFSAGIAPRSREAGILRDADRLDAIGAIGIARTFYVAGRMGSRLYDPMDPFATDRSLEDRRFALDHFEAKLFHLADGLTTPASKAIAQRRVATMRMFVDMLREEIGAVS